MHATPAGWCGWPVSFLVLCVGSIYPQTSSWGKSGTVFPGPWRICGEPENIGAEDISVW